MTKGEIAGFEQFLLLSTGFQKPSAAEMSESVYMRERVDSYFRYSDICSTKCYQMNGKHNKHAQSTVNSFNKMIL